MHNNSALQCKHDCVCINIILLQLSMSQGCFKDDQAFYKALRIPERLKGLKNISQHKCTTILHCNVKMITCESHFILSTSEFDHFCFNSLNVGKNLK